MRNLTHFIFIAFLAFSFPLLSRAQQIITVAGIGIEGNTGDGGSPLYAEVHWPADVAVDTAENLYIADALNNLVRKISHGMITTIAGTGFGAGTGNGSYGGDGAAATLAQLNFPTGVAVDRAGNVYIADQKNDRVRKVDVTGNISTIAGTGVPGFSGDGLAASGAQVSHPAQVAVDTAGNIFIADAGNGAIRKIIPAGTISTIAGTGTNGFAGDGGLANAAQLNNPEDVAVDDSGYVYIADSYNNRVRKIDLLGNISTIAGNGIGGFAGDSSLSTAAILYEPSGIAVDDSGNVFVAQLGDARIRKIDRHDTITTIAGNGFGGYNGDGRTATSAELWFPQGIAVRGNGNLYIADRGNNRIRLITSTLLAVNSINYEPRGISIYPNPSQGAFTVNISSGTEEQAQVTVTNITGEKVFKANTLTNRPFELKFDQPPGIYFLSAATSSGILAEKLVVGK